MNATEHIAEAESHLTRAGTIPSGDGGAVRYHVAVAQVHATLAVAVATENGNRMRPNPAGMRQR